MTFCCNVATLESHLWPIRPFNINPYYLINGTILGGKHLLSIKFLFWSSLQLSSETFPVLSRNELDMIIKNIYIYMFSCNLPVILARL